jgi:hypothetical protein
MSKQLAIFVGIGVVVVAIALVFIVYGNKGSHLELKGSIIKMRTGAIDENISAAVIDFRVENVSDIPFVVRNVYVTAEQANGSNTEGELISKRDVNQLLTYNKFLGKQYNEGLSTRDKIAPHQQIDRMVAVRFDIPQKALEASKQIRLKIEDMDGPTFELVKALQ